MDIENNSEEIYSRVERKDYIRIYTGHDTYWINPIYLYRGKKYLYFTNDGNIMQFWSDDEDIPFTSYYQNNTWNNDIDILPNICFVYTFEDKIMRSAEYLLNIFDIRFISRNFYMFKKKNVT